MTELDYIAPAQAAEPGRFLQQMLVIRKFEQQVEERYRDGEIPGFVHLAIGQEAVAVGACAALSPREAVSWSSRDSFGATVAMLEV